MTTTAQTLPVEPLPAISQAQRNRIRDLLEEHFNSEAGFYKSPWSDQKIARDAGVPFAAVSNIREIAYGPIKTDPEAMAIKSELDDVRTALSATMDTLAKLEQRLNVLGDRQIALQKKYSP